MMESLQYGMFAQTPELILAAGIVLVLILEGLWRRGSRGWTGTLALVVTVIALALALIQTWPRIIAAEGAIVFAGLAHDDGIASLAKVIILFSLALGLLLDHNVSTDRGSSRGYHALILLAGFGAIIMSNAANLISLVLGLLVLSVPLYLRAARDHSQQTKGGARAGHLRQGLICIVILLVGCACYFAGGGTLSLHGVSVGQSGRFVYSVGAQLILLAVLYKGSVLPFLVWCSDGSGRPGSYPLGVTAALATGATIFVLLRMFPEFLPGNASSSLTPLMLIVAMGLILGGNLVALSRKNPGEVVAGIAVAHAGYMLLGLLAFRPDATRGVIFCLATHVPILVTCFYFASRRLADNTGSRVDEYAGLGHRWPFPAAIFALMLISLAGLPPAVGFMGRVMLFSGVVNGDLVGMAVFAMLTSLVGAYCLFRIIAGMYMHVPEGSAEAAGQDRYAQGQMSRMGFWVAGAVAILFGLSPGPIVFLADLAARHMWSLHAVGG